jgi:hypothetical protein
MSQELFERKLLLFEGRHKFRFQTIGQKVGETDLLDHFNL